MRPEISCYRGDRLTSDQLAVARVMAGAISQHSEDWWAAGWMSNIEHELWDEACGRRDDEYEKTVARLSKLAGRTCRRRPRKPGLLAAGLKALADRFGVWVTGGGDTAISVTSWQRIHELWVAQTVAQRASYEEVWAWLNRNWGDPPDKPIPPMPKIKLPPMHASK